MPMERGKRIFLISINMSYPDYSLPYLSLLDWRRIYVVRKHQHTWQ